MKVYNYRSLLFWVLILSLAVVYSCKEDDEQLVANEIGLSGVAEKTVVEGDAANATVTVTYAFAAPARKDGIITISTVKENLTYGTNYTTDPAESSGNIVISFAAGAPSVSFTVSIIDDAVNLPDGSVTFTLASIEGETASISLTAPSFKLNITDNEGESINLTSSAIVNFGDVIAGTNTAAKEISFTTLNVVDNMTVTASTGFQVSSAVDGTYGTTATLASSATSFFARAAPAGGTANGELTGTAKIEVAAVSTTANLRAIVASSVGKLFWAENFEYPVDDTYPSYVNFYPAMGDQVNWGIIPVSAYLRGAANYNGTSTDPNLVGKQGLTRDGHLDTWYIFNRFYGIGMGDSPLSFTGYPGSGVGRTAKVAQDYSNVTSRASTAGTNPCGFEGEFGSKNAQMVRRFVENGQEITSGTVFFSAMIKVNKLIDETTVPVVKNEIMMLTGDNSFVNANAMKLCIKNTGSGFNFGVAKTADDGPAMYGSTTYNVGTTYLVIVKVDIKPDPVGSNPLDDELSVYVYKPGDVVPTYETGTAVPEAIIASGSADPSNGYDVSTGLETFFFREVADVFSANQTYGLGAASVGVHEFEFSGLRIATSWSALFLNASDALYDNVPSDPLQTMNYGQVGCTVGGPERIGNNDKPR